MRLTVYTDYTLRVLIYLTLKYKSGEKATIQEIAESYDISRNHLMKIVHQLSQEGIVETVRGRTGGVCLARAPADITVGEIVRFAEPDFALVECHQSGLETRCAVAGVCNLTMGMHHAMEAFLRSLDQISFDHAVTTPTFAASLLGVGDRGHKTIPILASSPTQPSVPKRAQKGLVDKSATATTRRRKAKASQ